MSTYVTSWRFLIGLCVWSCILPTMFLPLVLAEDSPDRIYQGRYMSSAVHSAGLELSFEVQKVSARQGAVISVAGKIQRINLGDPIILSIVQGEGSLPPDNIVRVSPNPLLVSLPFVGSIDHPFVAEINLSPEVPPGTYKLEIRADSGGLWEMNTLTLDVQRGR